MTLNYIRTIRWSAPERLNVRAQEREPTTMSDVYSLAMVIVEVCLWKKVRYVQVLIACASSS